MHQQWNSHGLHQLQGGFCSRDGVDAAIAIGGDAVRVEFDSEKVGRGSRQLGFGKASRFDRTATKSGKNVDSMLLFDIMLMP